MVTNLKHVHKKCTQYHRCYITNGHIENCIQQGSAAIKKKFIAISNLKITFLHIIHLEFGQDINAYKYSVGASGKPVTALSSAKNDSTLVDIPW